jgi:tetratricopeptide (TPR) repeat protein
MGEQSSGKNDLPDNLPDNLAGNLAGNDAEDWSQLGRSQLEVGSWEDAIGSFDQALQANPGNYRAWSGKAQALVQLERYEAAIDCYKQALNLNSSDPEIWALHGKTLGTLTRYREAIASYETALHLQQATGDRAGEAKTLFTLNMLYPLDGRMAESAKAFEQMTAILNELETQQPNQPFNQMSLMGSGMLPNQPIFLFANWVRRVTRQWVNDRQFQGKLRSVLLRVSWLMFFGVSLLVVMITAVLWSVRRPSEHSRQAS